MTELPLEPHPPEFPEALQGKRVITLNASDDYRCMMPSPKSGPVLIVFNGLLNSR